MTDHLELKGCRHDILGHYLKAIGLLRVLAKCAAPEHRDPDAEGWWDANKACFCLRSPKYPTKEKLVDFFAQHYQPTPLFAAWKSVPGCSASESEKIGVRGAWNIANELSSLVVSSDDRKKPANKDKLVATEALERYREAASPDIVEALDAITAPFLRSNSDNPLFLSKASAGQAHILRTHWDYLSAFQRLRSAYAKAIEKVTAHRGTPRKLGSLKTEADEKLRPIAELLPFSDGGVGEAKGKGTPFFPDSIKVYNTGTGWVTEKHPFNPIDFVLAVEGALAMRGSAGRTLAANSKRFAGFPFVFDAGEEMVNKDGDTESTSSALWLPVWRSHVTFAELSSFITDAQARLPGKDARFSAEFMRALHSQGVDAGFTGWQEFRFRQRVTDVPWVTSGVYVQSEEHLRAEVTRLNYALHPLDESHFLDQFEFKRAKGGKRKADSKSPHPVRATINAAMETATRETTPLHCLDLLWSVFRACRQMAISDSFRDALPGKRARFFRPLPMEPWNHLLCQMDQPEFRIARAVASITSGGEQRNGEYSKVLPMLGSLLPLKLGQGGWYLPPKNDPSKQAVWTGTDVCHDLTAVLARRYLDSLTDDRPALMPTCGSLGARLSDVLEFLNHELDDHLIARWIEALSLIGWESKRLDEAMDYEAYEASAIPLEYSALRSLLEMECEWQGKDHAKWKKRRSQQPIVLLCQRSATTLPLAVTEALRWASVWSVPNPYENKAEKERLAGRDIINPRTFSLSNRDPQFATRLAAAVCIPLHWRDRNSLYRAISLPQAD